MTLAYLGPEGTFSESAARAVVRDGEDLLPCSDVLEVLRAVGDGEADRAVVPIENTLQGSVSATLDALAFDVDLLIEAELELAIKLVLAAPPGVTVGDLEAIHSHPVPLAACRRWLTRNAPGVERITTSSTAKAAEEIAALGGKRAAILNPLAAERHGLVILDEDIADAAGNTTRFVVVGRTLPPPTGWDKTSLVVFIETNKPGALLKLLEIFAERDLNLTKIESRPTKHELGDYCFFLDVEGHLADERVGDAMAAVKRTHRDIKVLGSYRRSGARQADEARRIAEDDEAYRDAAGWLRSWRDRIG